MKQANIQITFEEEKLRALRRYIAKRDSTLEAELQKAAQRLYEKVVPAAVQEYISDCEQDEPVRKPQTVSYTHLNPVAVEYIRNALKRVRKKNSAMLMASQNVEDFDRPGVREMTKPLFSIPPHQFLFNCGTVNKKEFMDLLQLEESEFNIIQAPHKGECLYKCGNERYDLLVTAPAYKEKLFGKAGGR